MIERTDEDGRWTSDNGRTWLLVEPSAAFTEAERPPPPASTDDRLAALEAEVRGMKDAAKAEAAKATPTVKGLAAGIAQAAG